MNGKNKVTMKLMINDSELKFVKNWAIAKSCENQTIPQYIKYLLDKTNKKSILLSSFKNILSF